jgi:hypothetical protein
VVERVIARRQNGLQHRALWRRVTPVPGRASTWRRKVVHSNLATRDDI